MCIRDSKDVEQRMSDLSLLIKHTTTYRQLKPIYEEYKKARDKEKYLRGHESEIILFEAAEMCIRDRSNTAPSGERKKPLDGADDFLRTFSSLFCRRF